MEKLNLIQQILLIEDSKLLKAITNLIEKKYQYRRNRWLG